MTDIDLKQLAKNVGKAIGRQRSQAGLTQEQVAELNSLNCLVVSWRTFCVRPATVPPSRVLC